MTSNPSLPSRCGVVAAAVLAALLLVSCTFEAHSEPPAKLDRGNFHVAVEEKMEGEPAEGDIARQLIIRRMVLHGFTPVDDPEKARYLITGTFEYTFHKELNFEYAGQKQLLEQQYRAEAYITLKDRTAPPPVEGATDVDEPAGEEFFDIPELINGRTDKEKSKRDIRRFAATNIGDRLVAGAILGNAEVTSLIRALGDPFDPRTFNVIIDGLVKIGPPAVPYLLSMMLDERPVRLKGDFPGLTEINRDDLYYYHIADRALCRILKRESALAIDSSEGYYKSVITGWHWAWEDVQQIPAAYRTRPEDRATSVQAGTEEAKKAAEPRREKQDIQIDPVKGEDIPPPAGGG